MADPGAANNDILKADQQAQYARDLDRLRNQKNPQQNPAGAGRRLAGGAVQAAGSGLELAGGAANMIPVVGPVAGAALTGAGKATKAVGGFVGGGAAANDAQTPQNPVNAMVDTIDLNPLSKLFKRNLPPPLNFFVEGKHLTKPGGMMILWPLFTPLYLFFGIGSLVAWRFQLRRSDGTEITAAEVETGPIEWMILFIITMLWGLVGLFFVAIFGTGSAK